MKERFLIFAGIGVIALALIGLNAANYVQKEKIPDSEMRPNRSSFAVGPTGTRAFYDLLAATGKSVSRWQVPTEDLGKTQIDTFVIVGPLRRPLTDDDRAEILIWVSSGGRLVLFDRAPSEELLTAPDTWEVNIDSVRTDEENILIQTVDPSDSTQMTTDTPAFRPDAPTRITSGVNAVQPSKFYSPIEIVAVESEIEEEESVDADSQVNEFESDEISGAEQDVESVPTIKGEGVESPMPTPASRREVIQDIDESPLEEDDYQPTAPIMHFSGERGGLVANFEYGNGEIVIISDPYVISNAGIKLVDNSILGLNAVAGDNIAFDEFHHGYGNDRSALLGYLRGTPIVAIFLQIVFLLALVMYGRSRRFARPLTVEKQSRVSNLEYVAAMAQLKRRTKAHDLALENILIEFRRRASGLLGVNASEIGTFKFAEVISQRLEVPKESVLKTLSETEDIIHGASAKDRDVLRLARELRELEKALGLTRRGVSSAGR